MADGKSTQVLTLTIKDGQGNLLDIPPAAVTLNSGILMTATVSAPTRQSPSIFTVTVTAGKVPETVTVTSIAGGVTLSSAVVTLVTATPAQLNSVITVDKNAYVTGTDIRVCVTLKDINNNPVTGAAFLWFGSKKRTIDSPTDSRTHRPDVSAVKIFQSVHREQITMHNQPGDAHRTEYNAHDVTRGDRFFED